MISPLLGPPRRRFYILVEAVWFLQKGSNCLYLSSNHYKNQTFRMIAKLYANFRNKQQIKQTYTTQKETLQNISFLSSPFSSYQYINTASIIRVFLKKSGLIIKIIKMQLRTSNAHHSGPFTSTIPHNIRRHKQQPIFTYQSRDIPPQNIYYDKNPYLLQYAPSEPRMRPAILSKSRHSSQSREHSDHSSHRSLKVIRVNGLRQVQKPRLMRQQQQQSPQNFTSKLNDQTKRFIQRQLQLQGQNRALKQENQMLKQKIRRIQQSKSRELNSFQQRIRQLMALTNELEEKVQRNQNQWKQQLLKLQKSNSNL